MKWLLVIVVGLVVVYLIINQLVINTYDGATFSNSRNESIKAGYFIADYKPDRDSIKLLKRYIKSPSLWVEKTQRSEHFLVFFSTKEADGNSCNIIIDSARENYSNEYLLALDTWFHVLNAIPKLGYIYQISGVGNTIKVKVQQGSLDSGWKKAIYVDSLIYTIK